MAKGRRYGAERLLAATAGFDGGAHAGDGRADLPDLSEYDVWPAFHSSASYTGSALAEDDNDDDDGRWPPLGRARRWVERHVGGLSLAFEDSYRGSAEAAMAVPSRRPLRERHTVAASAPVDVPAWPPSLRAGSGGPPPEREEDDEDEEVEAEGEWLPPHEYLARAHGRSTATSSVLEGVGRTLKGRDVSRVRDAVWSKTGFFG